MVGSNFTIKLLPCFISATDVLNGRLKVTITSLLDSTGREDDTILRGIAYFTPIGYVSSLRAFISIPTCATALPAFIERLRVPLVELLLGLPIS